jgi:carboxypeptidase Q
MNRRLSLSLALGASLASVAAIGGDEPVDYGMVSLVRDEAYNNSKVMETLAQLTDVLGPRLTGSPAAKQANEWTRQQLATWGLANAHLEAFGPFGRGWSLQHVSVHAVSPFAAPLIALPKAWTPGTEGPVRGKVVKAKLESEADLEKSKGTLAGMIVLIADGRELRGPDKPLFRRYDEQELHDLAQFEMGERRGALPGPDAPVAGRPFDREAARKRFRFQKTLRSFLAAEKALASVEPSDRDGGIVRVAGGGSRVKGEDPGVPALVMAAEHYNRLSRLLDRKMEVQLEIDIKVRFHDDDEMAYNTIAEIPGTDKQAEVVMLGAHLDSWHGGTGATDNAAGVAVGMEAVRILKALDVKPKRTIRIALWTGEEQGLLGSRAYAKEHFASRPDPTDPEEKDLPSFLRPPPSGPLTVKPEHAKLSAYFNLDNGTGRIRGVYTQGNVGAVPIFEAWLRPFADLGAATVTNRNTGGTDHQSFDGVGLPGFQFIQDEADYSTRSHHTNLDVYDRLQKEDMMQASAIMASFVYHAAMREERFPRKHMPRDRPPPTPPPSPAAP